MSATLGLRIVALEASSGCAQDVKRSFEPVDADMDAFLCVKVGKGWQAIRRLAPREALRT